jgi:plastocyanin
MKVSRRTFAQLLGFVGLAGAGNAIAQGQGKAVEVTMHNDTNPVFDPANVHVKVGDTVRWINNGVLVHTVTFDPKQALNANDVVLPAGVAAFGSADLNQEDTFSHTFMAKGTYKYVCRYHETMGMTGTVTVS